LNGNNKEKGDFGKAKRRMIDYRIEYFGWLG